MDIHNFHPFKIVPGGSEMAAEGRVTLNRGGRNSRFDCIWGSYEWSEL